MNKFGLTCLVAAAILSGCSAQRIHEIEADLHSTAVIVAGAATAVQSTAQANPALVAEVGLLAGKLAGKAGVSAEDQSILRQTVTPENVARIQAVAARIAGATATGGPQ